MTATKRNRPSRADYFKVARFIETAKVQSELYTASDLCAFVERNTNVALSPGQMRSVFRDAGIEWKVIGAKSVEGRNRRSAKTRLDDIEPRLDAIEKRLDEIEGKRLREDPPDLDPEQEGTG